MWFVGWEASLDDLSHLVFRSMEQTSLWHLDSAMQITKTYTCNMEFPFWHYSFLLLLYVMVIKALQLTKLQRCPSLYLQTKPNGTKPDAFLQWASHCITPVAKKKSSLSGLSKIWLWTSCSEWTWCSVHLPKLLLSSWVSSAGLKFQETQAFLVTYTPLEAILAVICLFL